MIVGPNSSCPPPRLLLRSKGLVTPAIKDADEDMDMEEAAKAMAEDEDLIEEKSSGVPNSVPPPPPSTNAAVLGAPPPPSSVNKRQRPDEHQGTTASDAALAAKEKCVSRFHRIVFQDGVTYNENAIQGTQPSQLQDGADGADADVEAGSGQ